MMINWVTNIGLHKDQIPLIIHQHGKDKRTYKPIDEGVC